MEIFFNNLWRGYKYIFYREYMFHKINFGNKDLPQFSAILGMSISFWMIVFSIISLLHLFFDFKIEVINTKLLIIPIILVLIVHYWLFLLDDKYLLINEEFTSETRKEYIRNGWYVGFYAIGSIFIFIFILFIGFFFKYN